MAMPVDDPAATAVIEWIRPEAGGNRTGPPGWPVAVEIVFPWEEMRHYRPEHIELGHYGDHRSRRSDHRLRLGIQTGLHCAPRRPAPARGGSSSRHPPGRQADRGRQPDQGGPRTRRRITAITALTPRPTPPSHHPIRPGRSSPRPRSIGSPRRPGVSTIRPRPAPSQSSPPSSAAASGRRPGTWSRRTCATGSSSR